MSSEQRGAILTKRHQLCMFSCKCQCQCQCKLKKVAYATKSWSHLTQTKMQKWGSIPKCRYCTCCICTLSLIDHMCFYGASSSAHQSQQLETPCSCNDCQCTPPALYGPSTATSHSSGRWKLFVHHVHRISTCHHKLPCTFHKWSSCLRGGLSHKLTSI